MQKQLPILVSILSWFAEVENECPKCFESKHIDKQSK